MEGFEPSMRSVGRPLHIPDLRRASVTLLRLPGRDRPLCHMLPVGYND